MQTIQSIVHFLMLGVPWPGKGGFDAVDDSESSIADALLQLSVIHFQNRGKLLLTKRS